MSITATDIKLGVKYVNEYVLQDSSYIIRYKRNSGHNWLYLHKKGKTERLIRLLFEGSTKEVNAYLTAIKHNYLYMNETI